MSGQNEFSIYNHKIQQRDNPCLKRRINRIASEISKLDSRADAARITKLKNDLMSSCAKYFYISGLENASLGAIQLDEVFAEAFLYALDKLDSEKGNFVHLLVFKYNRAKSDLGEEEHKYWDKKDSLEAKENFDIADQTQQIGVISGEDKSSEEQALLKMLALIVKVLDATDSPQEEKKAFYTRIFFTETNTSITRQRPEHELYPLIACEHTIFESVNLAFQDAYTIDECRTVQTLWATQLIEGIPEVIGFHGEKEQSGRKSGWKIPGELIANFCGVSKAAISQQRSRYDELIVSALKSKQKI